MNFRILTAALLLCLLAITSARASEAECPASYARSGHFFSEKEKDHILALKEKARDERATRYQRKKAEKELFAWYQKKLKELGFRTRIRTYENPEMHSGKETFLQVIEVTGDLPAHKMTRNIRKWYGTKVGFSPLLSGSEMQTPLYFDSSGNLIMLDPLTLGRRNQVSQGYMHEIRHAYYLKLLKSGKDSIYHGSIDVVSPRYSLDPSGMYGSYMSFEEVSTYFHDATAKIRRFLSGRGDRSSATGSLHGLEHQSKTIAENIGKLDWDLDPSLITIDRPAKTITYPIYEGAITEENKMAVITYPMPSMHKGQTREEILRKFRSDMQEMKALAEKRAAWAAEVLRDLPKSAQEALPSMDPAP